MINLPHQGEFMSVIFDTVCLDQMCVYSERQKENRLPYRSSRVLKFSENRGDDSVYAGDVDGDGFSDRFIGQMNRYGGGSGRLEFGRADGTWTTTVPTRFKNMRGKVIEAGQRARVYSAYDTGSSKDTVVKFEFQFGNPGSTTNPAHMHVTVNALVKSGNFFFYNVDQCDPL